MNDVRVRSISLEQAISIALLTPMGDPNDPACQWGVPLLLWGPPGVGKSARVEAAAKATNLHLEEIFSSGHHPEDFTGVSVRTNEGALTRICPLDEVHRLVAVKRGLLFFDELSCAPPSVQSALLKVVMKRYIGSTYLPPGVRIIAAANPIEEAADGFDLPPPLANRFVHIEVPCPSPEEWSRWRLGQWVPEVFDMANGEGLVQKNWSVEMSKAEALFASFVRSRGKDGQAEGKSVLYNLPSEGNTARGRAWPSPRTMDFATRITATCNALAIPLGDYHELLAGTVGEGVARELIEWMVNADLPDPEDVLKNGWALDTMRVDRSFAVFSAVSGYVLRLTDKKKQVQYAASAWKLYDAAFDAGLGDVAVDSVAALTNNQLGMFHPSLSAVSQVVMGKCRQYAEIFARGAQ